MPHNHRSAQCPRSIDEVGVFFFRAASTPVRKHNQAMRSRGKAQVSVESDAGDLEPNRTWSDGCRWDAHGMNLQRSCACKKATSESSGSAVLERPTDAPRQRRSPEHQPCQPQKKRKRPVLDGARNRALQTRVQRAFWQEPELTNLVEACLSIAHQRRLAPRGCALQARWLTHLNLHV
jgi:hypothetical protein